MTMSPSTGLLFEPPPIVAPFALELLLWLGHLVLLFLFVLAVVE